MSADAEIIGGGARKRCIERCPYETVGQCRVRPKSHTGVSVSPFSTIRLLFELAVHARTSLEVEDVRPVVRLDPHGLVLVRVIQRSGFVCIYREMERRDAALERYVERGAVSVLGFLRDNLATAEAQLGRAAPWGENR